MTCPKPAATAENDVMSATIAAAGADLTITPPSGWNLIGQNTTGTSLTHWTYRKAATASEPADYSWTTVSRNWTIIIAAYSGVNLTTPIDASANDNEGGVNDATIAHPALTTTVAEDMHVALSAHHSGTTSGTTYTHPTGWSQRASVEPAANAKRNSVLGDRLLSALNPAGFDVTASLGGIHNAQPIALLPPPSDTTPPAAPTGLTAAKSVV